MAVLYDDVHIGGKGPRAVSVMPATSDSAVSRSAPSTPVNGKPLAQTATRRAVPRNTHLHTARNERGSGRPATGAALAYGLMVAWVGLLVWGIASSRIPIWAVGALVAVNVVTFLVYAADKSAARSGGRRTPENTLHLLSLMGGWPAAWFAQQAMRHKSSKAEFRVVYWATIVIHCVALGAWASGWWALR
jgi:uncharacterized membrane protein YsdA (DUF1294 family)